MNSSRRNFIKKTALTGAALLAAPVMYGAENVRKKQRASDAVEPFKLRYAPSMNMFREHAGTDPVDNIKFCYDKGFRAMFDNGLPGRPHEDQVRIANEMQRLGMMLGPFVLYADFAKTSFVLNTPEVREMLKAKMAEGIEVASRTGAKWALMVPGRYDEKLHRDFQTANVIDNLRLCCDIAEPAGLTIVLEPLNTLRNHPGLFLNGIPQAYSICRAVNRPSCKIVDDVYHQQITEGNLIPNIEAAWSEIAAFHCGDNPGRNEPGTGEINFKNLFKYIHSRNYDGVICMEHGKSVRGIEGEVKLIESYREADSFEV
ncbi:MAG TPA: TIM barrel protein [Bacteroidales bacterium]|nr:TIM barrel protein [Bacteroidales bacterium]HPF01879.1 TIM barrel protein [Bacteroidales bacterium]HPJ58247.1 TIM barrel protein [Bacteroidales bacterium]HPR11578.1 TIM barrel protein [Bacteroidales bacterium]HRW85413.1 TIM barrel protein [Bacteroidales bacterium]